MPRNAEVRLALWSLASIKSWNYHPQKWLLEANHADGVRHVESWVDPQVRYPQKLVVRLSNRVHKAVSRTNHEDSSNASLMSPQTYLLCSQSFSNPWTIQITSVFWVGHGWGMPLVQHPEQLWNLCTHLHAFTFPQGRNHWLKRSFLHWTVLPWVKGNADKMKQLFLPFSICIFLL